MNSCISLCFQMCNNVTHLGTEELAHLEIVAAIVHQLTKNLTADELVEQGFGPYYIDHTAGIWPQAAGGVLDQLQDVLNEARSFPESGALVINEFLPCKTIRRKIVGKYIMYYLPNDKEQMIDVLRILYGRRNLDELIREIELS